MDKKKKKIIDLRRFIDFESENKINNDRENVDNDFDNVDDIDLPEYE